uniref:DDE-1 domain-containing protein n=1 Tax=Amphimedon queenslandica TaxID=400682 RepID=A0A1X7U5H3_AMPQE
MKTRQLRLRKQYPRSMIGIMDETPLWLDMPGETAITHSGDKSVRVCTTGHDKARFTVVLSAMPDEIKLKPYVVYKGVRSIPEFSKESGVLVALSRNWWMNEELTKDCI